MPYLRGSVARRRDQISACSPSLPMCSGSRTTRAVWRHTSVALLLKLHVRPDVGRGHFLFSEVSGRLSLECSQQQVECIIKGVEDIKRGDGDYCIGGDDQQVLWFWWYSEQPRSNPALHRMAAQESRLRSRQSGRGRHR